MEHIKRARILVVDDDPASRRLVKAILAPLGVLVGEAATGREAIEMVEASKWDVVLLDLTMPDMDGFRALGLIRIKYPMEELPVVMVTGHDDAEARLNALKLRANDFLSKPVDSAELLARIGSLLTVRWAHEALEDQLKDNEETRSFRELVINTFIHDLRNALTGARAYVEIVLDGMPEKDDLVASHLGKALEAIDKSVDMTADALDVSRLEAGKLKPKLEEMGIGELVRARVAVLAPLARRRKIAVEMAVEPDLPAVRADHRMIERLLENLLASAMRNTLEGGKILVSARRGGKNGPIEMSVAHTGWRPAVVFPQAIFDERAQEELRRQGYDTGTGLGLTFCRLAAKCHQGKLVVEAGPERDTEFTFAIPVTP
jgi:CheY-like chemotaxis protein